AHPGAYANHIARQKRSHHRALRHTTTPAQRAQYVAESIALREAEGAAWTWALSRHGDPFRGTCAPYVPAPPAYAAPSGGYISWSASVSYAPESPQCPGLRPQTSPGRTPTCGASRGNGNPPGRPVHTRGARHSQSTRACAHPRAETPRYAPRAGPAGATPR